jgi:hypothetical protein
MIPNASGLFVLHTTIIIILLQSDLDILSLWSTDWKLKFNETKCSMLSVFSHAYHGDTQTEYHINGLPISPCNQQKDLGILKSSDLSWSHHNIISRITSKAYKILCLLRRTFASSNVTTKKNLYISLVRSQLTYGSQVWRPRALLQKDINPIEHIQRHATKYILNDYTSDYRTRLIILNLLPMSMLLELSDLCFFVKCLKLHESPNQSFNISEHVSFSHNNTRSGTFNKLVQPPIKHNRDKLQTTAPLELTTSH